MTVRYTQSDADALLPELRALLERLRDARDEVAGLRDAHAARERAIAAAGRSADGDPELAVLRLRVRGLVDRMQAEVARLDELGIVLREISTGLVDLPGIVEGGDAWLCWRLGEERVGHWHGRDEGFAARRPLAAAASAPAAPAPGPGGRAARPARRLVRQGDREKAFRPLPVAERRRRFEAGLAAYERGEPFEAHEELEPAWMGTDDLAERALHQGLIRLAAAYVHAGRRNPTGLRRHLEGAIRHLVTEGVAATGRSWGVDVPALLGELADRLDDPDPLDRPAPTIRRIPA